MSVQLNQHIYHKNLPLSRIPAIKTLIVGLGNTILSDDGIGIYVARKLRAVLVEQQATIIEASLAGLDMLDLLIGYDKVIIIDAIQSSGGKVGQIYRLGLESFNSSLHSTSPHDIDLITAIKVGKQLKLPVPEEIIIFAIEAADIKTFSEECTVEMLPVIDKCVEMIVCELTAIDNKASGK
jgi:hydrogenase maturation protease